MLHLLGNIFAGGGNRHRSRRWNHSCRGMRVRFRSPAESIGRRHRSLNRSCKRCIERLREAVVGRRRNPLRSLHSPLPQLRK